MILRALSTAVLAGAASLASAEPSTSPRGLEGFVTVDRLPVPDDPVLAAGRTVWGGVCQNCHGGNRLTGAPKITATRSWGPRADKGMDVLVQHAIQGFIGPTYTEMPARGGDPDLSDAQIAAAVAFMLWASGAADMAEAFAKTLEIKE